MTAWFVAGGCGDCEGEIKSGAFVGFSLRPDAASVLVNNALHRGQTNARTFEILGPMQPLENAKEFVLVLHVEADAIVADEDDSLLILLVVIDFDDGLFTRASKLERVGDQVLKNLL